MTAILLQLVVYNKKMHKNKKIKTILNISLYQYIL